MSRLIDFDAARAERTKEPLMLRAYGQTFELPGSLPAGLFLDIVAMEEARGSDSEVTFKDSLSLLQRVFPPAVLDQLLESDDFGVDDFTELAALVVQNYMAMRANRETAGNSPAPNRAARRATTSTRSRGSHVGTKIQSLPTVEPGETS